MKQLNWYQIFGQTHTIPDGRTVTPTDDIQIWLNCAGIFDKTYTTLAEVLADTDTLSALIASENAVDYMVRSTTWAVSISVPKMVSNTSPSGECFGSSVASGNYYYGAFDRVISNTNAYKWCSNSEKPASVGYKFTSSVGVYRFEITPADNDIPTAFTLQGSNDGVTWTDIQSYTDATLTNLTTKSFSVDPENVTSYERYRLYVTTTNRSDRPYVQIVELQFYSASITDNSTAMSYIGLNNYCANTLLADSTWCEAICNSEYFESVLNVKVPTMTSNTTPEGECFANGYSSNAGYDYKPFCAMDGNTSTNPKWWWCDTNVSPGGSTPFRIGYKFTTPVKVCKVLIQNPNDSQTTGSVTRFKLQGSNDGVTYTDVGTENSRTYASNAISTHNYVNDVAYEYYQILVTERSGGSVTHCRVMTLQFYGREDV